MAKATWGNATLADSKATRQVEGNQYFPAESVRREYLEPSDYTTECGWKGTAHYYNLVVDGQRNPNAAWYYPEPKPAAAEIKNYVAFWRGVEVES